MFLKAVGMSLKQLKEAGHLCALALDLIDVTVHANKSVQSGATTLVAHMCGGSTQWQTESSGVKCKFKMKKRRRLLRDNHINTKR